METQLTHLNGDFWLSSYWMRRIVVVAYWLDECSRRLILVYWRNLCKRLRILRFFVSLAQTGNFFFISRFAQKLYCWAVWKILSLKLLNYNAGCTKHWSGVGGWSKYLDLTNDHNKFWIFFSKVENFSRVLSLPQHYFFVCDFLANHHSRMFLFNCTRHKRRRELTPEQL